MATTSYPPARLFNYIILSKTRTNITWNLQDIYYSLKYQYRRSVKSTVSMETLVTLSNHIVQQI